MANEQIIRQASSPQLVVAVEEETVEPQGV